MKLDVIVVGHVAIDVNVLPWGIVENVLGGAPTYAGLALIALKKSVGIVSKVGLDFVEAFPPVYSRMGMDTEGIYVSGERSTRFKNIYNEKGDREQFCEYVAPHIMPQDIPEFYKMARSFYVSPIANEISVDLLKEVKRDDNLVMLDPQGLFRKVEEGKVSIIPREDLKDFLKYVDIVKVGKDELKAFKGAPIDVLRELVEMGSRIAIVTQGEKGCTIISEEGLYEVGSLKVDVKDLTGAGDVFGAAFLAKHLDGQDAVSSAKFACTAAGLKIRYKGPVGFPSEAEVLKHLPNLSRR